jgi:NDP-sugar pyrophosphorylase family protein
MIVAMDNFDESVKMLSVSTRRSGSKGGDSIVGIADFTEVDGSTKVGNSTEVDDSAEVGDSTEVDDSAEVGDSTEVDNSTEIDDSAEVDDSTEIDDSAEVDDSTEVDGSTGSLDFLVREDGETGEGLNSEDSGREEGPGNEEVLCFLELEGNT